MTFHHTGADWTCAAPATLATCVSSPRKQLARNVQNVSGKQWGSNAFITLPQQLEKVHDE